MPTLSIDNTGALVVPLRMVSGIEEVRVKVLMRLLTFRGDWLTDPGFGAIDPRWPGDGSRQVTPIIVESFVRSQVLAVDGVTEISDSSFRLVDRSIVGSMTAAVDVGGETGTINIGTVPDPYNTGTRIAWYVSVGTGRPASFSWS